LRLRPGPANPGPSLTRAPDPARSQGLRVVQTAPRRRGTSTHMLVFESKASPFFPVGRLRILPPSEQNWASRPGLTTKRRRSLEIGIGACVRRCGRSAPLIARSFGAGLTIARRIRVSRLDAHTVSEGDPREITQIIVNEFDHVPCPLASINSSKASRNIGSYASSTCC
jgi:hypothetical protein